MFQESAKGEKKRGRGGEDSGDEGRAMQGREGKNKWPSLNPTAFVWITDAIHYLAKRKNCHYLDSGSSLAIDKDLHCARHCTNVEQSAV